MQTRFFLEMLFYFALVLWFQVRLLKFTDTWNLTGQVFGRFEEIMEKFAKAEAEADPALYAMAE